MWKRAPKPPSYEFLGSNDEPMLLLEHLNRGSEAHIYNATRDYCNGGVPSGYHPITARFFGPGRRGRREVDEAKNDPATLILAVWKGHTRDEAMSLLTLYETPGLEGLSVAFSPKGILVALATIALGHTVVGAEKAGVVHGDCLDVCFFTEEESLGKRTVEALVEIRARKWAEGNEKGPQPLLYELGAVPRSMARFALPHLTVSEEGKGLLFATPKLDQVGPYYLRTNVPL